MKRKWYKGQFGIEVATPASELASRDYKTTVFDLRRFGVAIAPIVGQVSHRRLGKPSEWHVHDRCIELICCSAGACAYESAGNRYCLTPGMVFVSRADEPHRQLDCPKGYACFYLHVSPAANAASRWFAEAMARLPRLFRGRRSIPLRFNRLFALAESDRPRAELRIRLQTEVQALLLDLIDSGTVPVPGNRLRAIDEIAARMRQDPGADYPVGGLVAESGLSRSAFMAHFKAAHGHSPHAYLLCCRVEEAKALLRKGLSAREVAERLGFATAQALARTFKNFSGLSPRTWLKRNLPKRPFGI